MSFSEVLTFSLTAFVGLFAIMNPLADASIFINMTRGIDIEKRKAVAKTATITAFIIITAFVLIGKYIFEAFDLTIFGFKITGGIIVFYVGFDMIRSKKSSVQSTEKVDFDEGIAISPLAMPILAGPGTIVTAMNFVTVGSFWSILVTVLMSALVCWMNYFTFISSDFLVRYIGENKILVIAKIMGLIIAIIGTNMVIEGLKIAFPFLAK